MRDTGSAEAGGAVLLVVAAPAEARAVLGGLGLEKPVAAELAAEAWRLHPAATGFEVVVCGIGKANAAGATARFLDPARHRAVISLGVAGLLPESGNPILGLGSALAATASVFADEGLATPAGFSDCAAIGFPLGPPPVQGPAIPPDPAVLAWLSAAAGVSGVVATVSTCSGIDALARQVQERTSAVAEAMEGAAVGLVASRLGAPFGELRVISNTTGDRAGQRWDLAGALDRLSGVVSALAHMPR